MLIQVRNRPYLGGAAALLLAAMACSGPELNRRSAAAAIEAHLRQLAPTFLAERRLTVEVAASDVIATGADSREVRFRLRTGAGESLGNVEVLTASFARRGRAWALTRYDGSFSRVVAALARAERRVPLAPMEDFLGRVRRFGSNWESHALRISTVDEYLSGIPAVELRQLVEDSLRDQAAELEWGIEGQRGRHRRVVWARPASDSFPLCAIYIDPKQVTRLLPTGYYWIDAENDVVATCRTRSRLFNRISAPDGVLQRITSGGRILWP